jgi:hypothetical protein
MMVGRLARPFAQSIAVLVLLGFGWNASAQEHDAHHGPAASSQHQKRHPREGALVKAVREATKQFATVDEAMKAGYALQFGCVSGGEFGAMGLHFVNMPLVFDGELDVMQPEIVLYEPVPGGGVQITGADFLVLAEDWDRKKVGPPQLMGQLFHLFESPNRFGLPAFYTLHVWAWKDNPINTFGNWNPAVTCDAFNPPGS